MAEQELRTVHSGDFSPFVVNGIEIKWREVMLAPFEEFCQFTGAVTNPLNREGIYTVFDLASRAEASLRPIRLMAEKSMDKIKSELAKIGLKLVEDESLEVSLYDVLCVRLLEAGLTPELAAELIVSPEALETTVELANNLCRQRTGMSLLASDRVKIHENTALRDAYSQDHSPITIKGITYDWEVFLNLGIEVLEPLGQYETKFFGDRLRYHGVKTVRRLLACSKADLLTMADSKFNKKAINLCTKRLQRLGLRLVEPDAVIEAPATVRDRKIGLTVLLQLRPSELDLHPDLDKHYASLQKLLQASAQEITELLGEGPASWQNLLIKSLRDQVAALTSNND